LLAWVGQLILDSRSIIVGWYARLDLLYHGTGYLCILGAFLTVWWIFTQTEKRIQRLYFAPLLAFFVALAIYLLR
jgi:hypothetical protein